MPTFLADTGLNPISGQGRLSNSLPEEQWGIIGGMGDDTFLQVGRSGTSGAYDGAPFTVSADNIQISIFRLGLHEAEPNTPLNFSVPSLSVGNFHLQDAGLYIMQVGASNELGCGGANQQSYDWKDTTVKLISYAADNPTFPVAQEIGNWISRVPVDGTTPGFPRVNPTYKFDNVSFIAGSGNIYNQIPADDALVRTQAQLTFRASAIADDSEFGDIICWNGRARNDTFSDFLHTRSNVRGAVWIGPTYIDYGKLVVPPIGANQIISPLSAGIREDLRVVGFSNQGNQIDLAASEGGKYSYTNHYGIIGDFDCRSLQETPSIFFTKYTIEVSNDANIWFINPLLGLSTATQAFGNLDMTFLAGFDNGSLGQTAITDGGTANRVTRFHYNVTPLSVSGEFVEWYNSDRTLADVLVLPTPGNPIVSSDKLNVVVGHVDPNLDVNQLVDDLVAGGNLSQQLGDPYPNNFTSLKFSKTSSTSLNVIGAAGSNLLSDSTNIEAVDWIDTNFNQNVFLTIRDTAFTTYNGIGVAKVLVATAPILSDITSGEVGYHILTEDADRTRGIFPITSSSFNDRTTQPTEALSVVFDDTTDNLAVARVNQNYIGGIPNSGRLEQFSSLSGRTANYTDVEPLSNWDYRHYAWAQQPDRAEFGNQKQVAVPPLGATDLEVAAARRNGFSFRNTDGTWSSQVDINDTTDTVIAGLGHFEIFEARSKIIQTLVEKTRRVGNDVPISINVATANRFSFSVGGSQFTVGNISLQNALVVGGQTIRNSVNPYTITLNGIADQSGEINFRDAITVSPGDSVEFHQFYEANVAAGALTGTDLMGIFKGKQLNRVLLDTSTTVKHYPLPYARRGHLLDLDAANLTFVFPEDNSAVLVDYDESLDTWTIPTTRLNRDLVTDILTTGRVVIDARIVNELTFEDVSSVNDLKISNISQGEAVRYSLYNTATETSDFEGVIPAGGETILTIGSAQQNQLYRLGVTGQIYDDFITETDSLGEPLIQAGITLINVTPVLSVNPNAITAGAPSTGGLTPQVNEVVVPGKVVVAANIDTTWNALETVQGLSFLKFQTNHYVELITRLNQQNLIFVTSDSTVSWNNEHLIFSQEDGLVFEEVDPGTMALDAIFNSTLNVKTNQNAETQEYHPTDDISGGSGYENGYLNFVLNIPADLNASVIVAGTAITSGTSTASIADSIELGAWTGTVLFVSISGSIITLHIGFDTVASRDFVANVLESVSRFRTVIGTVNGTNAGFGPDVVFGAGITTGIVNEYYRQTAKIFLDSGNLIATSSWFIPAAAPPDGAFTIDTVGTPLPSSGNVLYFRSAEFEPIEDALFSFGIGSPASGEIYAAQPANVLHPKTVRGVTVQRYKGLVDIFSAWASNSVLLGCPIYLTNVVLSEDTQEFPFSRVSQIEYRNETIDFAVENRISSAGGASVQDVEGIVRRARNVIIGTR